MGNPEKRVFTSAFEAGMRLGEEMAKIQIMRSAKDLHVHNEHGAIVYLEELQEFLGVEDDEPEHDLP